MPSLERPVARRQDGGSTEARGGGGGAVTLRLAHHEPSMTTTTAVWRRLDAPGHDACRLTGNGREWRIEGTAIFVVSGAHVHLAYEVKCDRGWKTREGTVRGWFGQKSVDLVARRTDNNQWALNGSRVPGLEDCVDLDLGFTPATNLLQLRRLALADGEAMDDPVAWLNVNDGTLSLLRQRYERRSSDSYWYEAPRFEYSAMIEVDESGFPKRYPDLWEAQG